jgi:hypothetical protein
MIPGRHPRASTPPALDLAKHDHAVVLGGRTFAVRAYLDRRAPDGPGWHAVIVENRTPIDHELGPTDEPEACFAAAVSFLTAKVAAGGEDRRRAAGSESEGGTTRTA